MAKISHTSIMCVTPLFVKDNIPPKFGDWQVESYSNGFGDAGSAWLLITSFKYIH